MEALGLGVKNPTPSFWKDKRVLLTGNTGFKGTWISLWLAAMGARVAGYALEPPTTPSLHAEAGARDILARQCLADIGDFAALAREMRAFAPEIVIHMAAQPLVLASYADPVGTFRTNVMGTAHVLEAMRSVPGVRCFLNVTTDKCYENKERGIDFKEQDPLGGKDPYSSSKACSELVTGAYRDSFFAQGLTGIATARAGNVIGGGDWSVDRLVPDLLRALAQGRTAVIRNPAAIRPWQHVLEPLCGYLVLLEAQYREPSRWSGGWNFGPRREDARPVAWIADRMVTAWGEGAAWSRAARQDEGQDGREAMTLQLDISKVVSLLGWQPRWGLETTLERTTAWHKAWSRGTPARDLCVAEIEAYLCA